MVFVAAFAAVIVLAIGSQSGGTGDVYELTGTEPRHLPLGSAPDEEQPVLPEQQPLVPRQQPPEQASGAPQGYQVAPYV
jgi:hypothetical protein